MAAGPGFQMLYNVLQVFMVDRIKFCHGISIDFKWTQGKHTSCAGYGGTGCLSEFPNFVSEEKGKFITGPWKKGFLVAALLPHKQTILAKFRSVFDHLTRLMVGWQMPLHPHVGGTADRCNSGGVLILFLSSSHVSDPALNILICCISDSFTLLVIPLFF